MIVICIAVLVASPHARSQSTYPDKPVRVIVPFLGGGALDLVARLVSDKLAERWSRPFVVESRAGAGGTIGADFVAKSAPDGYTLLLTPQAPLAAAPFLMRQLPYDARSAFAPVSLVASAPNVMIVHADAPFRTVRDFIAYAKAHPGSLTYGSQGPGTTGHLTGTMLTQEAGLDLVHVPYKGFPPLLIDLKTGRVLMMFADTVNVLPRIRSHELLGIAIAADKRSPLLPDLPTFAESGYPSIVTGPSFLMVAPAATPLDIRRRLADAIRETLRLPDVARRLDDLGVESVGSTPEALAGYLKKEYVRSGEVIRAAGISAQ